MRMARNSCLTRAMSLRLITALLAFMRWSTRLFTSTAFATVEKSLMDPVLKQVSKRLRIWKII